MMTRKLKKISGKPEVFDGVCAGIAYWLAVPTVVVRVLFVLGVFFGSGMAVGLYIICMFVMDDYDEIPDDYNDITSS